MLLWVELALLLACIVLGARLGGMALGPVAGLVAVVTALELMQAAGGLDYVVERAEAILRPNPKRITVVAPLVTYALIAASGTQHVIYALLPVIAEVAQGRRAAGAPALDQCDRGAARSDCIADLGRDSRVRALWVGAWPPADRARHHPRDTRRGQGGNTLGGVPRT